MSTNINIAVWTGRWELDSVADTALKAATRFWFVVTVIGQLLFGLGVAAFYGRASLRGDSFAWNRFMTHGYVPGDRVGNAFAVVHVIAAVIIMLAGATQLVPRVRERFPVFHRWNGRIYMLVAVTTAAAGFYMTWIRGSIGDFSQHLGGSLNAVLVWAFAALALRSAMARDFKTHRRWALRLFLVVSAAWFYRIGFFLTMIIFQRPVGFDPAGGDGRSERLSNRFSLRERSLKARHPREHGDAKDAGAHGNRQQAKTECGSDAASRVGAIPRA